LHNKYQLKQIAIIGSHGLPPRYGGFETLADNLVKKLSIEFSLSVYCSSKIYEHRESSYNGAKLIYLPLRANGIQSIIYDVLSIFHALRYADVFLVLGVSGCIIFPLLRLFSKKKILVNIDGLEWSRDKWSGIARIFLKLSERLAVRYASAVIVDNEEIQNYIAGKYGVATHLIEYGGDHLKPVSGEDFINVFPSSGKMYALSVCRIEPENNIHTILNAFSKIDDFPLVIVGNWNNSSYGRDLRAEYRDYKNIFLLDAIYEEHKLNALRSNCYVYIHGHSAGGTNPSLVEAMSLKLPVIAYDVSYNRATTEGKAIYFKDSEDLMLKIKNFDSQTAARLSSDMSEIARRRYRWDIIAQKYASLF